MSKIRDHVWIWGHPPGKLNEPCNLDSQMTPMESALYLGARNVFYIPMGKKMNMTQCNKAMDTLNHVGWAIEKAYCRPEVIDRLLQQNRTRYTVGTDQFVRLLPLKAVTVRIPKPYTTPRPIEYIPIDEIAAAMLQILSRSYGLTEEALCIECARIFGFERRGPRIKARTEEALALLKRSNRIRLIDEKIQLVQTP